MFSVELDPRVLGGQLTGEIFGLSCQVLVMTILVHTYRYTIHHFGRRRPTYRLEVAGMSLRAHHAKMCGSALWTLGILGQPKRIVATYEH